MGGSDGRMSGGCGEGSEPGIHNSQRAERPVSEWNVRTDPPGGIHARTVHSLSSEKELVGELEGQQYKLREASQGTEFLAEDHAHSRVGGPKA